MFSASWSSFLTLACWALMSARLLSTLVSCDMSAPSTRVTLCCSCATEFCATPSHARTVSVAS